MEVEVKAPSVECEVVRGLPSEMGAESRWTIVNCAGA